MADARIKPDNWFQDITYGNKKLTTTLDLYYYVDRSLYNYKGSISVEKYLGGVSSDPAYFDMNSARVIAASDFNNLSYLENSSKTNIKKRLLTINYGKGAEASKILLAGTTPMYASYKEFTNTSFTSGAWYDIYWSSNDTCICVKNGSNITKITACKSPVVLLLVQAGGGGGGYAYSDDGSGGSSGGCMSYMIDCRYHCYTVYLGHRGYHGIGHSTAATSAESCKIYYDNMAHNTSNTTYFALIEGGVAGTSAGHSEVAGGNTTSWGADCKNGHVDLINTGAGFKGGSGNKGTAGASSTALTFRPFNWYGSNYFSGSLTTTPYSGGGVGGGQTGGGGASYFGKGGDGGGSVNGTDNGGKGQPGGIGAGGGGGRYLFLDSRDGGDGGAAMFRIYYRSMGTGEYIMPNSYLSSTSVVPTDSSIPVYPPVPSSSGGCVSADSKIWIDTNGNFKSSKDLEMGDPICFLDNSGELKTTTVKDKLYKKAPFTLYRLILLNGQYIDITSNHQVMLSDGSFKSIDNGLSINNVIATTDGNFEISSISELETNDDMVYNFTLNDDANNFICNGIIVSTEEYEVAERAKLAARRSASVARGVGGPGYEKLY